MATLITQVLLDTNRSFPTHPARFPYGLPEFFIKFLTDEGDLVVDPFAGSVVTGEVCESLQRHWLAFELVEGYLEASKFRFPEVVGKAQGQISLLQSDSF